MCRRDRAGFALTSEGRRVYDSSLRVLTALYAFRGEVGELHADLVGTLALGLLDKTVPVRRLGSVMRCTRSARRLLPWRSS